MKALILSFFAVLFSIDIPSSMYTGERMISDGIEQVNLFGSMFRIAGFAEDANYAFLFLYPQFIKVIPAVTQIAHTAIRMQFIQQIQINIRN